MTTTASPTTLRELDARTNDGIVHAGQRCWR